MQVAAFNNLGLMFHGAAAVLESFQICQQVLNVGA